MVTEASICVGGWSDVHKVCWNTHVFSVELLVKKLHYTLLPSGHLHNSFSYQVKLQVIIIRSKYYQTRLHCAIPVILRPFQMTLDQSLSFRILFEQNLILFLCKVHGFFSSSRVDSPTLKDKEKEKGFTKPFFP